MHQDEADPELMFQDWEGIPDIFIGESWVDDNFWQFIEADGNFEAKVAFISFFGEWDEDKFEELSQGEYESELDFTYEFIESCGVLAAVDEGIQRYFDYESYSRDLFISDYVMVDGFVFSNA